MTSAVRDLLFTVRSELPRRSLVVAGIAICILAAASIEKNLRPEQAWLSRWLHAGQNVVLLKWAGPKVTGLRDGQFIYENLDDGTLQQLPGYWGVSIDPSLSKVPFSPPSADLRARLRSTLCEFEPSECRHQAANRDRPSDASRFDAFKFETTPSTSPK